MNSYQLKTINRVSCASEAWNRCPWNFFGAPISAIKQTVKRQNLLSPYYPPNSLPPNPPVPLRTGVQNWSFGETLFSSEQQLPFTGNWANNKSALSNVLTFQRRHRRGRRQQFHIYFNANDIAINNTFIHFPIPPFLSTATTNHHQRLSFHIK